MEDKERSLCFPNRGCNGQLRFVSLWAWRSDSSGAGKRDRNVGRGGALSDLIDGAFSEVAGQRVSCLLQ